MSPAIYSQSLCFYVNICVGSWSQALQPKPRPYLQQLQMSVLFLISFIKRNCSSGDLTKIPQKSREVFQYALSLWSRWPLVSCSVLWKSLISSSSLTSNDSSWDDNLLYTNSNIPTVIWPQKHIKMQVPKQSDQWWARWTRRQEMPTASPHLLCSV